MRRGEHSKASARFCIDPAALEDEMAHMIGKRFGLIVLCVRCVRHQEAVSCLVACAGMVR